MILYKLPSRSRPQKMFAAIDNIFEMSVTEDWIVQLTLDADDKSMLTPRVLDRIKEYGSKVIHYYGFSDSKVAAINRDTSLSPNFDIMVVHSDDMVVIEKGFDSFICEDMQRWFNGTDGVLHYLDGSPAKDNVMTWPVIGRQYFDRFNYIFHDSYKSVFCDNEMTEIAKQLGRYKFISRQLVSHNHPIWRKAEWDELYRRNEESTQYAKDRATYFKRLSENFGL